LIPLHDTDDQQVHRVLTSTVGEYLCRWLQPTSVHERIHITGVMHKHTIQNNIISHLSGLSGFAGIPELRQMHDATSDIQPIYDSDFSQRVSLKYGYGKYERNEPSCLWSPATVKIAGTPSFLGYFHTFCRVTGRVFSREKRVLLIPQRFSSETTANNNCGKLVKSPQIWWMKRRYWWKTWERCGTGNVEGINAHGGKCKMQLQQNGYKDEARQRLCNSVMLVKWYLRQTKLYIW